MGLCFIFSLTLAIPFWTAFRKDAIEQLKKFESWSKNNKQPVYKCMVLAYFPLHLFTFPLILFFLERTRKLVEDEYN